MKILNTTVNSIFRYIAPLFGRCASLVLLSLLLIPQPGACSTITWILFLRPSINMGPVLTVTTGEGEPFIVDTSTASGNSDALEVLDGASFLLEQSPVDEPLTIHLILNVRGDEFESIMGVTLGLNLDIEVYVNGKKNDDRDFFRNSPLIMTIPAGNGLRLMTDRCDCGRNELTFGYYPGGKFDREGITTSSQVQGMVVRISATDTVIGGKNTDLGFSSNTGYETWFKIKKLFE